MIVARAYPRSVSDLSELLAPILARSRSVVAQAGHFLLFQEDPFSSALPCISSEIVDEKFDQFRSELGEFPLLSWRLAHALLSLQSTLSRSLLVLVNDWQYVMEPEARAAFYREQTLLPPSYLKAVTQTEHGLTLLTPSGRSSFSVAHPFFGEQKLRNAFKKRMEKLIKAGAMDADTDDSGATCSLIEVMGERREIYCSSKNADCAGEVAQLIDQACALTSCDTFINFNPAVCKQFVEVGSELAPKVLGSPIKRIVNISLPAARIFKIEDMLSEAEVTVHEF